MKISTISTFTDWGGMGGCYGRFGVFRIFDYLKIAGIKDVYWRVYDGGTSIYPSKIAQNQDRRVYETWMKRQMYPKDSMFMRSMAERDFSKYDPLADAVEAAEEYGINLHFWYTIYEDDHGGAFLCEFAENNKQYWQMDREGNQYRGTLDWFFDEVREYKLKIVDELLEYKPYGMYIDLVRHNACPSSDENGIHRFGYNPQIREAFKSEHGEDPIDLAPDNEQWLQFKRDYQYSLLKTIRDKMDKAGSKEMSLMLWPVENRDWACFDIKKMTDENMVQMVSTSSLKYSFSTKEIRDMYNIIKPQINTANCRILPGIMAYNKIYPAQLDDCVKAAEELGVKEIMLHEADSLVRYNLGTTVRAVNMGSPNYTRVLEAAKVESGDANSIDWGSVPGRSDFFYNTGTRADKTPSEKTEVKIAYNDKEIIFRVTAYDSQMEKALAPVEKNLHLQYYLDALGARTHEIYTMGFNLYLDPQLCHQDFYHFYVSPTNERIQETFVEDEWCGKWYSDVVADDEKWVATIRIPYESMNIAAPEAGVKWGINMIRGIRHANESNIWTNTQWMQPYPDDMGQMKFL